MYRKPWTNKERKFLSDNINVLTNFEISKELSRTEYAVATTIRRYKIQRDYMVAAKMRNPSGANSPQWKGGQVMANARFRASHKEELALCDIEYKMRYPERVHAGNAARYALKTGKIKKQPCKISGDTKNVVMHHDDYNKPYNVIFLSRSNHMILHLKAKRLC